MKYQLRFKLEVEDDAISSFRWYESKSKGLGEEFLRIFYATAIEICRSPLIYRKVYNNFRRRLLRRFPYAIYFIVNDDNVIIYGLFHTARDPGKMENILNKREM